MAQTQAISHGATGDDAEIASHPKPGYYVGIFVILLAITILEVFVAQEPLSGMVSSTGVPVMVPLVVLAAAKFAMIAAFYMHLKMDSRLFMGFLVLGLILAFSMLMTFMGLFTAHPRTQFDQEAWRAQLKESTGAATTGEAATTGH
jgi:cytochrome c oxidase subunit IV